MNKVRHEAKFDFLYVRKLQGKRARGGAMGRESEADRWEDVEEVNESGGPLSTPAKPTETRSRMRSMCNLVLVSGGHGERQGCGGYECGCWW